MKDDINMKNRQKKILRFDNQYEYILSLSKFLADLQYVRFMSNICLFKKWSRQYNRFITSYLITYDNKIRKQLLHF